MEDEDWHEDTFEWKEKERQRKPAPSFDPNDPSSFAAMAGGGGGGSAMQVGVAPL